MNKWYEDSANGYDVIVSSKIRLVRNLKDYPFSLKMTEEDSEKLLVMVEDGLQNIFEDREIPFRTAHLSELTEIERLALKERRILNSSMVKKKQPVSLVISEDESTSLIVNGDDHIRIQLMGSGNQLKELWKRTNELDDAVNEKFDYAFDEKYGYLTSYPTNVGTGLRASLILHLPALSSGTRFRSLIGDMGRFGISIRGLFGEGNENYGCLYEIMNLKTLGQSELSLINVVERVALQLANQEKKVRNMAQESHQLEQKDEIYKAFGVLKYARRLSLRECMIYFSHLRFGISEKMIEVPKDFSLTKLLLGILPANLQKLTDKPLTKAEIETARAEFVRTALPDID